MEGSNRFFSSKQSIALRSVLRRLSFILLVGGLFFSPISPAQIKSPLSPPPSSLTEQQRSGKVLFLQNCALCHLPRMRFNVKGTEQYPGIAPSLNGRFRGEKPLTDAVARTLIQRGVPDKMPSFQYGLDPKEIDAIIAYLKTL